MSIHHITINKHRGRGAKVWQVRVQVDGRRKSRNCATREAARLAERQLRRQLEDASAQEEASAAPATLGMLLDGYAEHLRVRGKAEPVIARVTYTRRAIEAVLPELLAHPVDTIVDDDLFAYRAARERAKIKPSTVNRDLRTLRAALKLARPSYRFPGGAFYREDETRVRWLRPEEELAVLEPMRSPFREIAKLAALSLMRQTEIRLLRREMVHLDQGVILLPRAKGGARPVILSRPAHALLREALASHAGEWVFPNPAGRPYSREQVGRVFRRAAQAAGLRDFHFHDLRHHGATMALNAGFRAPIVMALGGRKTEKMMRRYAAVTDETLRAAAEAIAGHSSNLTSLRAAGQEERAAI
jgi:integrase